MTDAIRHNVFIGRYCRRFTLFGIASSAMFALIASSTNKCYAESFRKPDNVPVVVIYYHFHGYCGYRGQIETNAFRDQMEAWLRSQGLENPASHIEPLTVRQFTTSSPPISGLRPNEGEGNSLTAKSPNKIGPSEGAQSEMSGRSNDNLTVPAIVLLATGLLASCGLNVVQLRRKGSRPIRFDDFHRIVHDDLHGCASECPEIIRAGLTPTDVDGFLESISENALERLGLAISEQIKPESTGTKIDFPLGPGTWQIVLNVQGTRQAAKDLQAAVRRIELHHVHLNDLKTQKASGGNTIDGPAAIAIRLETLQEEVSDAHTDLRRFLGQLILSVRPVDAGRGSDASS